MAKRRKANRKDFLDDVSKALARPGTSYLEAAEKLRVHKNKVKRPAEELGGRRQEVADGRECNHSRREAACTAAASPVPGHRRFLRLSIKQLLRQTEKPLSLILSFDEATAGNVLAPDPAKKACMVYIACKEVGMQNPALWWPIQCGES